MSVEGVMDSQNLTNDNIELQRREPSSTKWLMYTTGRDDNLYDDDDEQKMNPW